MKFTEKQLEIFKKINMEPTEENYNKLYNLYKKNANKVSDGDLDNVTGGTAENDNGYKAALESEITDYGEIFKNGFFDDDTFSAEVEE